MRGPFFSYYPRMSMVILLNKPYGVICQFSPSGEHRTLKDFVPLPDVYAAGRLDTDSEGLVVLTDDGALQHRIADPGHKLAKTYFVEVEGAPDDAGTGATADRRPAGRLRYPSSRSSVDRAPGLAVAARATDPDSPGNSDLLAQAHPSRRPQPPGPAHDRGGWVPHAAADPLQRRPMDAGRHSARDMENRRSVNSAQRRQPDHGRKCRKRPSSTVARPPSPT